MLAVQSRWEVGSWQHALCSALHWIHLWVWVFLWVQGAKTSSSLLPHFPYSSWFPTESADRFCFSLDILTTIVTAFPHLSLWHWLPYRVLQVSHTTILRKSQIMPCYLGVISLRMVGKTLLLMGHKLMLRTANLCVCQPLSHCTVQPYQSKKESFSLLSVRLLPVKEADKWHASGLLQKVLMLCSVYCEHNIVLKINRWCADFALSTFVFHLWSCPEEEEEVKMSESDEDRRIAEAKAYRIQKYQGVVPFLLLWELRHPQNSGWINHVPILAGGFRVTQQAESQQRQMGWSYGAMWV